MNTIDIHEIQRLLPHRYPFLLIDRVIEFTPGEHLVGIKNITFNEPQFTGHFPQRFDGTAAFIFIPGLVELTGGIPELGEIIKVKLSQVGVVFLIFVLQAAKVTIVEVHPAPHVLQNTHIDLIHQFIETPAVVIRVRKDGQRPLFINGHPEIRRHVVDLIFLRYARVARRCHKFAEQQYANNTHNKNYQ